MNIRRSKYSLLFLAPFCLLFAGSTKAQKLTRQKTKITTSDTLKAPAEIADTVSLGYYRVSRKNYSGAVSSLTGTNLGKDFNTNLGNSLYGRLPGLNVVQNPATGEPGLNSPNFYIRGVNTFSAAQSLGNGINFGNGTSPLTVVDGFTSNFTQLIPEEIESIVVLKDASATAIYGLRGANGVIVVNTRKGSQSGLSINFNTKTGFSNASYLPRFLDAYNYSVLYNEARVNDGLQPLYSSTDLAAYANNTDPLFHPNVRWYDEVLRKTAAVGQYDLNLSGGDKTVRYFVLLNAISNQGLYRKFGDENVESSNANYNRYNFRTNVNINLSKRLSVDFLLGGTIEDKSNPANYNASGIFSTLALLPPNAFPVRNADGTFARNQSYSNPVGDLLNTGFYSTNGRNLQGIFRLNQQLDMLTKGLSVSASVALNTYFTSYSSKSKTYQSYLVTKDPVSGALSSTSFGANTSLVSSETQADQFNLITFQGLLNYNRTFGKHQVAATVVYNDETANFSNTGSGRNSTPYYHLGGGGRASYTYNEKYVGEFSFGYQGSEQFPADHRFGFFPAGSVGWILSKEDFLKDSRLISFLKIRGSYGLTGNDNIADFTNNLSPRFAFTQYYPFTASYYFGTSNTAANGRAEGPLANAAVTWEKERKLNIGLDATIFNNLQLSFDVYNNDRSNILVSPNSAIPTFTGVTLSYLNLGKSTSKGFEAALRYNGSFAKDFGFFTELNAAYAKSKIVYNAEALQLYSYQSSVGQQIGQPFGLVALGLLTPAQAADPAVAKPVGVQVQAGDIRYADLNGDGRIDQYDTRPIGNSSIPTLVAGFHGGFSYKNFDLDFVAQAVTGRTVYLGGAYYQAFQNNGQAGEIALDRYTPGTAATATYPRLSLTGNQNNYRYSSFWQRNGDFLKLRSAEIGYTLSPKLVSKIRLKSARIFINGTNLLTFDKLSNTDPETLSGYPPLRTFCAGVNVKL